MSPDLLVAARAEALFTSDLSIFGPPDKAAVAEAIKNAVIETIYLRPPYAAAGN